MVTELCELKSTRAHSGWRNSVPGQQAPIATSPLPCRWYCLTILQPSTLGTSVDIRVNVTSIQARLEAQSSTVGWAALCLRLLSDGCKGKSLALPAGYPICGCVWEGQTPAWGAGAQHSPETVPARCVRWSL